MKISSLLFILCSTFSLWSQTIRFEAYTIDQGLPENTGNVLLQDRKGQLWIGTQAGVAIYDGVRFTKIGLDGAESKRLSNNMVESMFEDSKGRIFIGTRNGLNIYDPTLLTVAHYFPDPNKSYGNNYIRKIFHEDETGVWFHSKSNLFLWDKSKRKIIQKTFFDEGSIGVAILYEDRILVARDSALYWFDGQEMDFFKGFHSDILSIATINDEVWLGTRNGIYTLDGKVLFPELLESQIMYTQQDRSGKVWIGTASGLWLFDHNQINLISANEHNRLTGNLQLAWLEDAHGLLWFGNNAGINTYNPATEKIRHSLDGSDDLLWTSINSMTYSTLNDLLAIGTEHGVHIYQFDSTVSTIQVVKKEQYLQDTPINFVDHDTRGRIWIGTKNEEIYCILPDFSLLKMPGKVKGIRGFHFDSTNETVWIAGSNGLFALTRQNEFLQPDWAAEIDYTVSLLSIKGELWVAHLDRVFRMNLAEKSIREVQLNEGHFQSNMLTHVLTSDSLYWFSSISGGVFSYRPGENKLGPHTFLNGSNVWSIYEDKAGRFWSSSDGGIYVHDGQNNLGLLLEEDGLNYNDFKMTSHAKLKDGSLIFGNSRGLNWLHPNDFSSEMESPELFISALEINFEEHATTRLDSILLLQPDEKTLSFKVGLTDFHQAKDGSISYQLAEDNSEWSSFFPITYPINLNGLKAGDYTLKIRFKDKSGRISTSTLSQAIKVLPYFYQTWWFKFGCILIGSIFIYLLSQWRSRQKQKSIALELKAEQALSAERERISRDIHDSIGTRLTKIITDLDIISLKSAKNPAQNLEDDMNKTRDYAQETINNLRETIWTLDNKVVQFKDLHHQIEKFLQRYLPDNIQWSIWFQPEIMEVQISPTVSVNLFRIIQELSQNMLKYSQASHFEIRAEGVWPVHLTVQDNGVGFDFETISKGEGLKNILARIAEINGNLKYFNADGSRFEITITKPL